MLVTEQSSSSDLTDDVIDARVVFLTHYIPLYQVRVLQSIARSVRDFHVLLSTPIEPNRDFELDWADLNVTVQNTWTMRQSWRHRSAGFEDPLYVHIPYDTTRQLKSLKPDVVMSLELGARSAGASLYCQRNRDCKLVLCTYMSQRTEQGRGWLRSKLRKRLIRSADAVTYNGPSCREYLESFDTDPNKLFHLPYAADDRSASAAPVTRQDDETRSRLLCVGQLSERKGVLPMLEQVAAYCRQRPDRQLQLAFAGEGPLRDSIETFDVPENLTLNMLGNLSPAQLSERMSRSGALIAPTLADEWLVVVNEALQAGLPVIGSVHAQAVTTLIDDDVNGWQFDPTVSGSLARSIDSYLDASSESIAEMREACRESISDRTPEWAASGAVDAIRYVMNQEPEHSRRPRGAK